MQLHFNSISEPGIAGPKWQKLFYTYWADYLAWLNTQKAAYYPSLASSQAALHRFMPEMIPTYAHLCELVNADEVIARFLTGYQPPAYISGCSQAVLAKGKTRLVRNYDYHPSLMEGTLLLSAWNGKKVIANTDCLMGVLDGMNEDGLVISLTFGGRKKVGKGFGIPFILRYILEFCSNVEEAVAALVRIPSHISYNVTVIDKSGAFKTVQLTPDREPVITEAAYTTNHQEIVEWPENAQFNNTVERAEFLENILSDQSLDADTLIQSFLAPPLYNTQFAEGFGTLYTAAYCPEEGSVQMCWPTRRSLQSFADFREESLLIPLNGSAPATVVNQGSKTPEVYEHASFAQHDSPLHDAEIPSPPMAKSKEKTRKNSVRQSRTPWEAIAIHWTNIGKTYWEKWKK